jgi:hypothetical protein
MKRFLALACVVLCLLAWAGCSVSDPVAGGSGTETTNSFAMLSTGEPADSAVVRLIDTEPWLDNVRLSKPVVIDSTVTDANGAFTFESFPRNKRINLQIDHSSEALFLTGLVDSSGSDSFHLGNFSDSLGSDTVYLASHAAYNGVIGGSGTPPSALLLSGSAYQVSLDRYGGFSFGKVAAGLYPVLALDAASPSNTMTLPSAVTLSPGTTEEDSAMKAHRVLVDNFEAGIGKSVLGLLVGAWAWYYFSDSAGAVYNTETGVWHNTVSKDSGNTSITLEQASDGEGGNSLLATVTLRNRFIGPYAGLGMIIGFGQDSVLDLSAMSGFSLRARGSGTVGIRFESAVLDSAILGLHQYEYDLALQDAWTEYTFPVDSLHIDAPDSTKAQFPWSGVSSDIIRIEFEFVTADNALDQALTFQLDEFYIEGVTLEPFIQD